MLSTGFSVDVHYCMGKRLGVSFHVKKNDKCERCGMKEKKGGCCSNETKFFKLNLPFKSLVSSFAVPFFDSYIDDSILFATTNFKVPQFCGNKFFRPNAYSFSIGPPIFIRNRNFRL